MFKPPGYCEISKYTYSFKEIQLGEGIEKN